MDEPDSHWLVDSRRFSIPISTLIFLNTIQIGLACDLRGGSWDKVWEVTEHFFTLAFTLEMVLKLFCLGMKYFKDKWNLLDFALVWTAIIDAILVLARISTSNGNFTLLRILRLSRTIRMVRMFKVFKELIVLVEAIFKSVRTMGWVLVLMLLILYVFSIVCVEMVGRDSSYPSFSMDDHQLRSQADNFNNFQFFGTISRSMYTLFSLITLSEWSTVSRPIAEIQPWILPALIAFTMVTAFGVMNVVIGIMVEHALDAAMKCTQLQDEQHKQEQMRFILDIRQVMIEADENGDGFISLEELESAINRNVVLAGLMSQVDLPDNFTIKELFTMIDGSGDGEISPDEFEQEMFRLVNCSDFQRMCLMQLSLNQTKSMVSTLQRELEEQMTEIRKLLSPGSPQKDTQTRSTSRDSHRSSSKEGVRSSSRSSSKGSVRKESKEIGQPKQAMDDEVLLLRDQLAQAHAQLKAKCAESADSTEIGREEHLLASSLSSAVEKMEVAAPPASSIPPKRMENVVFSEIPQALLHRQRGNRLACCDVGICPSDKVHIERDQDEDPSLVALEAEFNRLRQQIDAGISAAMVETVNNVTRKLRRSSTGEGAKLSRGRHTTRNSSR